MINSTTIARPYAYAVVQIAAQEDAYMQWSDQLKFLAAVCDDSLGKEFLKNLAVSAEDKAEFLCSLAPDALTDKTKNLIRILAEAKRLLVLPALYIFYEKLRKKAQHKVSVNLSVGRETTGAEVDDIAASIVGDVSVAETLDKTLIAGGVLVIENRVVDGSFRGRLQAMRETLLS